MHDDSDVKIFTAKKDEGDGGDLFAVAEEIKKNILNGNSAKAKAIGKELASLSPENAAIRFFSVCVPAYLFFIVSPPIFSNLSAFALHTGQIKSALSSPSNSYLQILHLYFAIIHSLNGFL